ncbi:MAG: pyridoxamine 5'-phosphate oxidase family protein [Verrucomicrobia bacterium]|nr:pyridoxamine 5'-phosphate oxidase family protein [Verrucomicrobiota bacterium]MDA1068729.1 pyridoxamine 5'-phosphate oxidase family protein [Verrucomicrobiota bacterium]
MAKPIPEPIDPEKLAQLAQATMQSAKFPCLASMDGDQARLRPISPVRVDGFTVYVANLKQYHKTGELEKNPKVELCYLDSNHNQVRITGVTEVLTDDSVLQEIWDSNPLLRSYLGKRDNPNLIVYKIVPNQVRYMREWALEYYDIEIS